MLVGPTLRLRATEPDDLPLLVGWLNQPAVRRGLAIFAPLSLAQETFAYQQYLEDRRNYWFLIELREGEGWRPIGSVGTVRLDPHQANCQISIQIGEMDCWGHGYGGEALGLLLDFLFHQVNLHRVELSVFAYNTKAIRCYEKLGFRLEGRRRQAGFQDGQYWDSLRMSLLAHEWRPPADASAAPAVGAAGAPGR